VDDVIEMGSLYFYPHIKLVLQESVTTFCFVVARKLQPLQVMPMKLRI
jgi:hypothetical protein